VVLALIRADNGHAPKILFQQLFKLRVQAIGLGVAVTARLRRIRSRRSGEFQAAALLPPFSDGSSAGQLLRSPAQGF